MGGEKAVLSRASGKRRVAGGRPETWPFGGGGGGGGGGGEVGHESALVGGVDEDWLRDGGGQFQRTNDTGMYNSIRYLGSSTAPSVERAMRILMMRRVPCRAVLCPMQCGRSICCWLRRCCLLGGRETRRSLRG